MSRVPGIKIKKDSLSGLCCPCLLALIVVQLGAGFLPGVRAQSDSSSAASNFGRVLPSGGYGQGPFHADLPLSQGSLPSSGEFSAAQAVFGTSGMDGGAVLQTSEKTQASASFPIDRPRAWYKFLEPSLNLARALEESERKRILSVVPVPMNLNGTESRDKQWRVILLRAGSIADYACFKTICGSVFARSGAVLVLSSSAKAVRILNLNGKEKDILFKLSNGQVITVGPGSEMVISKHLSSHDLNIQDSIARRGFTQVMKCNEQNMAFCQYSYETALKVPELKFFFEHQSSEFQKSMNATIAGLNEIRGKNGFKFALSELASANSSKLVLPKKDELRASASLKAAEKAPGKEESVALLKAGQAIAQKSKRQVSSLTHKQESIAAMQIAGSEMESGSNLSLERKRREEKAKKAAQAQEAIAGEKEKKLAQEARALQESKLLKAKAAREAKELEKAERLSRQERAKELAVTKNNEAKVAEKSSLSSFGSKLKLAAKKMSEVQASAPRAGAQTGVPKKDSRGAGTSGAVEIASLPKRNSSETRHLLPRKLPGPNTPPEIAKLLLEADKEEKLAASLRKKADKCIAFAEGGLMNPEQQRRMMMEAKRHLQESNQAEERCQALRRQAEIADNGKSPL